MNLVRRSQLLLEQPFRLRILFAAERLPVLAFRICMQFRHELKFYRTNSKDKHDRRWRLDKNSRL